MTEVRIRNVDDWVVESHRQKAKRDGRSLENELRDVLTNAALERKRAIAAQMRADLDELRRKYGEFPDSTPYLREARPVIVVDANVALKWLLPEPGADAALELIGGETLYAPSLIRIEVLSGITRCVRQGIATKEESLSRCKRWYGYLDENVVSVVADTALLDDAVSLSMGIKHALKDCLYLAAAKSMDGTLVTADRTFAERAKKAYRRVELLKGCDTN